MSNGMPLAVSNSGMAPLSRFAVESAGNDSASCALGWAVGFFFSFRAIFVFISARWINAGTEPGVLFTFSVSAILFVIAVVQAFGPHARPVDGVWKVPSFRWMIVYLAFSGCSLLWTRAASQANSALYWCALVTDVTLVLLVLRGADTARPAYSIMKGFVWSCCILAAIAWLLPLAQDLRLGDLEYFNTNQIANLCALSIFLCSFLAARNQGKWLIPSVFLTLTLFRSLSKATLVAFVASQAYRFLFDRSMTRGKKMLLGFCAVAVVVAFWGLLNAYADIYATTGNQAESLTGRTAIWAWSLEAALSRPWIGNGIDAMWKVAPPFGGELFEARHAENEFIQQLFAYGIAGVAMLIGIYSSLGKQFRSLGSSPERSILISLLIFILVRGLAEAEPFDLLLPLWLITTIVLLLRRAPHAEPGLSGSAPNSLLSEAHGGQTR